MPDGKNAVTLDDFDAACADEVVKLLAAGADKIEADKGDVEVVTRMLWTLGQVPAVADAAQCASYLRQMQQLLFTKIGPNANDRDFVIAFFRTGDGALAMALSCRIDEWNRRSGH
jgi:hypothetical protein